MAFEDYSATPSLNTSIGGQNIAPGGPPSAVGPGIRQLMADGKSSTTFLHASTGAVATTLPARAQRQMFITDFLPSGFVTTGGVDYTAAIQAAMTASANRGIRLEWIDGIFDVTGTGPLAPSGLKMKGQGRERSIIRNLSGNVLRMNGTEYDFEDLFLFSAGGGHTVVQTGSVNRSAFRRVGVRQDANGYSLWNNATYPHIKNDWIDCFFQHTETATVPGFNLISANGDINNNTWDNNWIVSTGDYGWNVESTGANAQYNNQWLTNTFEIASGGGIRQIACKNSVIRKNSCWDVDDSTQAVKKIKRDFYYLDRNASGVTSSCAFSDNTRLASVLNTSIVDIRLASGGGSGDVTLSGNATVGGGDPFLIDAASNFVTATAPNTVCQLTNGSNATIFDPLSGTLIVPTSYGVNGTKVVGAQVTGFGAIVGTANKVAIATYTAAAISASPTQAQVQAIANATQEISQRLKAVDDALRAHGLIGT